MTMKDAVPEATEKPTGDGAGGAPGGDGYRTRTGSDGDDELVGGAGNDRLIGLGGQDLLYAAGLFGGGNVGAMDILDGGPGLDFLFGAYGSQTYLYGRGDGPDLILNDVDREGGSADPTVDKQDVLQFKPGISVNDVAFSRSGDDLILTIAGSSNDRVNVTSYFVGDGYDPRGYALDAIRFDDGTSLSIEEVKALVLPPQSGSGPVHEIREQLTAYAEREAPPVQRADLLAMVQQAETAATAHNRVPLPMSVRDLMRQSELHNDAMRPKVSIFDGGSGALQQGTTQSAGFVPPALGSISAQIAATMQAMANFQGLPSAAETVPTPQPPHHALAPWISGSPN